MAVELALAPLTSVYAAILTFTFRLSFPQSLLSTICQLPDRLNRGPSGPLVTIACVCIHLQPATQTAQTTGRRGGQRVEKSRRSWRSTSSTWRFGQKVLKELRMGLAVRWHGEADAGEDSAGSCR